MEKRTSVQKIFSTKESLNYLLRLVKQSAPTSFQIWQPKMMRQLRTLRVPFATGLLAASLTAAVLLLGDHVPAFAAVKESSFETSAYTSFASLIGFMTVFRTGQAYVRFAEGTMLIHQILGDWHDATSTLVAFCRYSEADKELVVSFQQKLVRLMSLLNAMILGELEGDDSAEMAATRWELIDVSGLDRRLLALLARSKSRPEIVFQWVQNEIVDNIKTGVLTIPPPLLTRAFQELANGMMKYHDAAKLARVPFPLPYTIVVEMLLAIYAVVTPIVMSTWAEHVGWGALFSFVLVFVVWSMHVLALELENPYGLDANDLDMSEIQCELNRHLVAALAHSEETAKLIVGADEAVHRLKTQYRQKHGELDIDDVVLTSFSSLGLGLKAHSSLTLPDVYDYSEDACDDEGTSFAAVQFCEDSTSNGPPSNSSGVSSRPGEEMVEGIARVVPTRSALKVLAINSHDRGLQCEERVDVMSIGPDLTSLPFGSATWGDIDCPMVRDAANISTSAPSGDDWM